MFPLSDVKEWYLRHSPLKPEVIKVKLRYVKQEENVKESIAQTKKKGQAPLKNLSCCMLVFVKIIS